MLLHVLKKIDTLRFSMWIVKKLYLCFRKFWIWKGIMDGRGRRKKCLPQSGWWTGWEPKNRFHVQRPKEKSSNGQKEADDLGLGRRSKTEAKIPPNQSTFITWQKQADVTESRACFILRYSKHTEKSKPWNSCIHQLDLSSSNKKPYFL